MDCSSKATSLLSHDTTALANMQSILSLSLLLLAKTAASYLLPNPPGQYNVTLTTGPLIDYTRNDSNSKVNSPRALMLSVFQPATCASTISVPYMPYKTAEYQGPYLQKQLNYQSVRAMPAAARLLQTLLFCSYPPATASPVCTTASSHPPSPAKALQ
jgi:hypothetical protein